MARNIVIFGVLGALSACTVTTHDVAPSQLGALRGEADLLAVIDAPGPIQVDTVASADWSVELSGLLNLEDPRAAGIAERDEPIQIYFHALRHPEKGLLLIDTGIGAPVATDPEGVFGWASGALHVERLHVHETLGSYLKRAGQKPTALLLTHLHLDHVMGLPDLPRGTPLVVGPGEVTARQLMNAVVRGYTDDFLAGHAALSALPEAPASGRFRAVYDLLGDGTLWAIHVPGHTAGSLAFVARTPDGPVLFTGDTCHTRWGWEHGVGPGTFSADRAGNQTQLDLLRQLVAEHPTLHVRLGHQAL